MNGFFVTISNDLLEDKHFEKMGNAVWLYMWFIDKMTEISEGLGIVSYGNPVSIDDVRENFPSMSERTYHRMIQSLRDAGYINTGKARYGLYITVNKPKKYFGSKASPAKNGGSKESKPIQTRQKRSSDLPNLAPSPAKSGVSLYIDNNTNNNTNNTIKAIKKSPAKKSKKIDPHKELVSKLYYEAIKSLDIPVTNHNTLRVKINEMANDKDPDKIINYLTFMRDQFATVEWDYKPHVNEALDIYRQRAKIRQTFVKYVRETKENEAISFGKKR